MCGDVLDMGVILYGCTPCMIFKENICIIYKVQNIQDKETIEGLLCGFYSLNVLSPWWCISGELWKSGGT